MLPLPPGFTELGPKLRPISHSALEGISASDSASPCAGSCVSMCSQPPSPSPALSALSSPKPQHSFKARSNRLCEVEYLPSQVQPAQLRRPVREHLEPGLRTLVWKAGGKHTSMIHLGQQCPCPDLQYQFTIFASNPEGCHQCRPSLQSWENAGAGNKNRFEPSSKKPLNMESDHGLASRCSSCLADHKGPTPVPLEKRKGTSDQKARATHSESFPASRHFT